MLHIVDHTNWCQFEPLLAAMYADRKRIFVDQLNWKLPITNARYEIDQFDDDHAVYVIASDDRGNHLGSFRLLQSERPHILDGLFAKLCDRPVPRGASIREITRFCVSPIIATEHRRPMRNRLISALVDHALDRGITAVTGVVTTHFLNQILAMGWNCEPLGKPLAACGVQIGAFCAQIEQTTLDRLTRNGIYSKNQCLKTSQFDMPAATMVSA